MHLAKLGMSTQGRCSERHGMAQGSANHPVFSKPSKKPAKGLQRTQCTGSRRPLSPWAQVFVLSLLPLHRGPSLTASVCPGGFPLPVHRPASRSMAALSFYPTKPGRLGVTQISHLPEPHPESKDRSCPLLASASTELHTLLSVPSPRAQDRSLWHPQSTGTLL